MEDETKEGMVNQLKAGDEEVGNEGDEGGVGREHS